MNWRAFYLAAAVLALEPFWQPAQATSGKTNRDFPPGVAVERVVEGGAAGKAGIRAGDVLLSWEAPGEKAKGALASPFDLWEAEAEYSGRSPVRVHGKRGPTEIVFVLQPGNWGIVAEAHLAGRPGEIYRQAASLSKSGKTEEGARGLDALASQMEKSGRLVLSCWLRVAAGQTREEGQDLPGALKSYLSALALSRERGPREFEGWILGLTGAANWKMGDTTNAEASFRSAESFYERRLGPCLRQARCQKLLGDLALESGELKISEARYRKALQVTHAVAPGTLAEATALHDLGIVAAELASFQEASELQERALQIRKRLQPESVDLATSLADLGVLAYRKKDAMRAEALYAEAIGIFEKTAPAGMEMGAVLNSLGVVRQETGDLAGAEAAHTKVLSIVRRNAPGSVYESYPLNNLGNVYWERGDLARAEEYYRRVLEIRERLSPESLDLAMSKNNLAMVLQDRGDAPAAGKYFEEALETYRKVAPDHTDIGTIVHNMGIAALDGGELETAMSQFHEALRIRSQTSPDNMDVALTADQIGLVLMAKGDLGAAEECFRWALEIEERLAPGGTGVGLCFAHLAQAAEKRGDDSAAESLYRKNLAISQRLTPGSHWEAEAHHALGAAFRGRGDLQGALPFFQEAVEQLEEQRGKLGGGSAAAERFSAKYADYYRDLVELQLLLQKREAAFISLERFRARSLLDMLAERDLDFAKDAPEDLIKEQKRADFEYDKIQKELAEVSPETETEKVESLRARLRETKEQQRIIGEKIKSASPKLSALQYPKPLDLAGTEAILPPSTLFLSYCAGEKGLSLFTLQNGRLEAYSVPVTRVDLQNKVRFFRQIVSDPTSDLAELDRRGRELYALLLKPAQKQITKAQTLLICPDGPLHYLPFAALKMDTTHYVAEEKPLACAVSATVYAELAKGCRGEKTTVPLAAFGDPVYPGKERAERLDGIIRYAARIADMSPLPSTRHEVEGLKILYENSGIFLGERATEEEAKKLGKGVPLIHFACHGIVDERFPLDSGLALTIPEQAEEGKDNGLLQAWEIFEKMRIDADLVTLSACETGLGKEMGGEGLIGLTRAFQYAGARSVLSSLWSVSDKSTAELMKRFYGYLKEGKPKAEALRLAQMEMIHGSVGGESLPRSAEQEAPIGDRNRLPQKQTGSASPSSSPSRSLPPSHIPHSTFHIPNSKLNYSHPFYWAGFVLNGDWK